MELVPSNLDLDVLFLLVLVLVYRGRRVGRLGRHAQQLNERLALEQLQRSLRYAHPVRWRQCR